jgi:predicted transcriptional regulator
VANIRFHTACRERKSRKRYLQMPAYTNAAGERELENQHYAFILVSDEKNWNKLCERKDAGKETHAFVRKNLVAPVEAKKLLFYVKKPAMQIRGVADFIERQTGDVEELWKKFGVETCFATFEDYRAFALGRQRMTFVRFKNLTELENPFPAEITASVLGSLRWFRGRYVTVEVAEQLTGLK